MQRATIGATADGCGVSVFPTGVTVKASACAALWPTSARALRALSNAATALVLSGALAVTVHRAAHLPLTYDEAVTWLHHVTLPWWQIVLGLGPEKANNHLLNTLMIKLLTAVLGAGELAIRGPALLGHVLYLFAVSGLVRHCVARSRAPLAALLLVVHPAMLDLFGLARGYALGLGFAMQALVALLRWATGGALRDARVAARWLCCASIANLMFLDLYLALLVVLFAVAAVRARSGARVGAGLRGVIDGAGFTPHCLVLVYTIPIHQMLRAGHLYYGAERLRDSWGSLVAATRWLPPLDAGAARWWWLPPALIVAGLVIAIWRLRAGDAPGGRRLLLIATLPLLLAAIAKARHLLLRQPFPLDRTALPWLLPLPVLVVLLSEAGAASTTAIGRVARLLWPIAAVLALWNTAAVLDPHRTWLWPADAHTRTAMAILRDIGPGASAAPARLVTSWQLAPVAEYYRRRLGLDWLAPIEHERSGPRRVGDYFLVLEADVPRLGPVHGLRGFADAGVVLAEANAR